MEDFLNNLDQEDEPMVDADAFVKPVALLEESDVKTVIEEAKAGNIVLLNITDLSKRNALRLKDFVGSIREQILQIDGDIARISQDRVLITPSRVKIIKKAGR